MTELELLREVAMLCLRYSVLLDHRLRPVHASYELKGWPDCAMIGYAAAAFRELKNATRAVTPEQQHVGARMLRAGLDWDVWRPADYDSGRIEWEVATLAGPGHALARALLLTGRRR